MFVLAEMQDIIRIEPRWFGESMEERITEELNRKFANKVVHKVGLCICLFDLLHVGDSYLFPGDGASHTKVKFRFIVFRPFINEVLVGKIRSCSPEGVKVSLGFFDDVFIPHQSLQHPKRFDHEEQLWVWQYEAEDGRHDLFMDVEEEVRLRVIHEEFVDTFPSSVKPHMGQDTVSSSGVSLDEVRAPYTISGSISESGLGLVTWW